jgi:hypothetical protein
VAGSAVNTEPKNGDHDDGFPFWFGFVVKREKPGRFRSQALASVM